MPVCPIQNLSALQTALVNAPTAAQAGEAIAARPLRFDDEGLRLTGILRSAIHVADPEVGAQFARTPTFAGKAEVVSQLGSAWLEVQKNLALLFAQTAEVSQIAREKLRARSRNRDMAKEGESLAALISGLNFSNRDVRRAALPEAEIDEAIRFVLSMKDRPLTSEAWRIFALGFYESGQMRILFGRPENPFKPAHRDAAALAETLLLANILKREDRNFAAQFLMIMEPKTPAEFFLRLADVLSETAARSTQLIAHHPQLKNWEAWEKDQAELAAFGDVVKAIRLVLREADKLYPEEIDLFHSRLRELRHARASELMDTIARRAQLARTAPSRQPEFSEPSPESPPSAG